MVVHAINYLGIGLPLASTELSRPTSKMCMRPYLGSVGLALLGFLESKLKHFLLLFLQNCKYPSLTGSLACTEHARSLGGVGLLLVEFSEANAFYIQNCKYPNLTGSLADTEPACLLGAVGLV